MALELRSAEFRREREQTWRALEALVTRAEQVGIAGLGADDLARFPTLYRATLSSLSVARAISLDANLLAYLEALAARAYLSVYGVRERPATLLASFFAWRLPAAIRGAWREIALSTVVLMAGILVAWLLTMRDPGFYDSFVSPGLQGGRNFQASVEDLRNSLGGHGEQTDKLGFFAAWLFQHNAQIGMMSFALGFALGVPTVLLVFSQGLMLGAFLALFQSNGLLLPLGGWLSIHGPTELGALVLSGAGGLRLGAAILFAGREPRLVRLARDGRDAAIVMMGAVLMFLVAGLLEGLGRQLILDTAARYVIGWTFFAGWLFYFVRVGRR